MTSFLETQLRNSIASGFKGKLLTGTLRRFSNLGSGGLDEYGDPTSPTPTDYSFDGLVSQFTAFQKANAGIPETDEKVIIIAGSLDVEPQKDDYVLLRSSWRRIRAILNEDPGQAVYVCQSFEIEDEPT